MVAIRDGDWKGLDVECVGHGRHYTPAAERCKQNLEHVTSAVRGFAGSPRGLKPPRYRKRRYPRFVGRGLGLEFRVAT